MALMNKIQVRRDTDANRLASSFTPDDGELIWATDTKKLWVGDGSTIGGIGTGLWTEVSGDRIYYGDETVVAGDATAALSTANALEVHGSFVVDGSKGQAYVTQQVEAAGATSASLDFDLQGNSIVLDLSASTGTVVTSFANGKTGASYLVKVLQHATTPQLVTWPGSVVWLGNEPTLTTTAGGFNVLTFYYDGTNYIGTGDANIDGGTI